MAMPDSACSREYVSRARAVENHVYYLAVNRVGEEGGVRFLGRSLFIDCEGSTLAEGSPVFTRSGGIRDRFFGFQNHLHGIIKYLSRCVWEVSRKAGNLSVLIRHGTQSTIHDHDSVIGVTTAIFANGPYERRFRDLHTVTQQMQGRKAHYETVGAFLLGNPPDLSST